MRKTDKEFDQVPNNVRAPLLYNYISNNYSFLKEWQDFILLKKNGLQKDYDFWSAYFSKTVNLGFIPLHSKLSLSNVNDFNANDLKSCLNDCNILIFNFKSNANEIATLIIGDALHTYDVKFNTIKGDNRYVIQLERLWFWNFLNKETLIINFPNENFKFNTYYLESNVLY
jgi:hypothetical protein